MAGGDIRVERGVAVFGASANTIVVNFGTQLLATHRAILRITNTVYASSGTDANEVANRNVDDLAAEITSTSVDVDKFTITRPSGGDPVDVRVHWELWEYRGPAGGPNEFRVIDRAGARMLATVGSGTYSLSGLTGDDDPADWGKVAVLSAGNRGESTTTAHDRGLVMLGLDTTGGSEAVTYSRGDTADVSWCAFQVVDFRGSNYAVEQITHTQTTAGANETEAVSGLASTANAVVFSTYKTALPGLDETGWNVWFASASLLNHRMRAGAGTTGNGFTSFVVENSDWDVQHLDSITGSGTDHVSGTNETNVTVTSVDLDRSGVIATSDCNGSGTAYPRQYWGYRLSSSTNAQFRRGRNGQAGDWTLQVVEFNSVSGSGSSTLGGATSTGTAAVVKRGQGIPTIEGVTASGSGAVSQVGTGSVALAGASSAGSGTVSQIGSGAVTLAPVTAAGSGTVVTPATHTWDLATHLPGDFAFMWDLGWFGVSADEGGPDPTDGSKGTGGGYGNWQLASASYTASDPVTYPGVPYATVDPALCADYYDQGRHRQVASYHRPLPGIYSSSGQDAQGLAKADLDLALLRRSGDPRGRCTAWACEVAYTPATEIGGNTPGGDGWMATSDLRVKNLQTKLARAEADSTLGPCITFAYNAQFAANALGDTASELVGIAADLVVYVNLLAASPKALRVAGGAYDPAGRLVVVLWIGADNNYTAAEWNSTLDAVRVSTGEDFYVLARYDGLGVDGVFDIADGVWPWVGPNDWASATGATERLRAADWTRLRHDQVLTEAAAAGADRVVVGSLVMGFEDWAKGFGQGLDRDIPRSEELVQGQIDRFLVDGISAIQCVTWNDYNEGSVWEPTVARTQGLDIPRDADACDEIGWLTEGLGRLYIETVNSTETDALKQVWLDYQGRSCPAFDSTGTGNAHSVQRAAGAASAVRGSGVASIQSLYQGPHSVARSGGVASKPKPAGAASSKWQ